MTDVVDGLAQETVIHLAKVVLRVVFNEPRVIQRVFRIDPFVLVHLK
jgi:hypothetical protein